MSLSQRIVTAAVIAFFVSVLGACQPGSKTADGTAAGEERDTRVAGHIGGESVAVWELDAFIKEQLFLQATKGGNVTELYEVRQRQFQRMASERALNADAAEQGLSPEELLTRESRRDINIEDAQIQALYEANKAQFQGRPFEDVAPMIRGYLERQRTDENGQRYLASLRDRVKAEFALERVRVEVAGSGPSIGNDDAPITIVEFSDYECPFCKQAEAAVTQVRERYPDQIRFEYRHFPLEQIHPNARGAAEAASCAETQDQFWAFHELVFGAAPTNLSNETLREHAEKAGLDLAAYDACVSAGDGKSRVDGDLTAGREAGVEGTPTFFINGIPLRGGGKPDDFVKLIDQELERIRAGG